MADARLAALFCPSQHQTLAVCTADSFWEYLQLILVSHQSAVELVLKGS